MNTINNITIVGTLIDVSGLHEGMLKKGKNVGHNYIGGTVIMKVTVDGQDNSIPISIFASDTTADGQHSKLYDSYQTLKTRIGTRLAWTNASVDERRFVNRKGEVVSAQEIKGRFFNKPASYQDKDEARFELGNIFVASPLEEKKNKKGEIYAYEMMVGVPNYSGTKAASIKLHVRLSDVDKIQVLKQYYIPGKTVSVGGDIRYITETREVEQKSDIADLFGKPEAKVYTNTYSYFYITTGKVPLAATDPDCITPANIAVFKEARMNADAELLATHGTQTQATSVAPAKEAAPSIDTQFASLL